MDGPPETATVAHGSAAPVEELVTLPLMFPVAAVTLMVQEISGPNQAVPSCTSLYFSVYVPGVLGALMMNVKRPTCPFVTLLWSTSVGL